MNGAERIAAERQRQIDEEGYDLEHDAHHDGQALAYAAACYAAPDTIYHMRKREGRYSDGVPYFDLGLHEPWPANWARPVRANEAGSAGRDARIRELEKAGALVAAEIDRLLAKEF